MHVGVYIYIYIYIYIYKQKMEMNPVLCKYRYMKKEFSG